MPVLKSVRLLINTLKFEHVRGQERTGKASIEVETPSVTKCCIQGVQKKVLLQILPPSRLHNHYCYQQTQ